jgi:hypothetical protein
MPKGYTLQKIADAVGVSVGKVHNVVGDLIFNSEIENARGQLRPMQYAARAVGCTGRNLNHRRVKPHEIRCWNATNPLQGTVKPWERLGRVLSGRPV